MSLIADILKKIFFKNNPNRIIKKLEGIVINHKDVINAKSNSPSRFEIVGNMKKSESSKNNVILTGNKKDIYFFQTILGVRKSFLDIKYNPKNPKIMAPVNFIKQIKIRAKKLGATKIGFTKIESGEIFKNKGILFDNAIVLTMEMEKIAINKAPSIETKDEVFRTYRDLGVVAIKLAKFIRRNGFSAHTGHPLGGLTLYPRIGQKAGLGWRGRHGLLISPGVGPRQRIAVVYTSIINLPFSKENKYSWIEEFCKSCDKCIKTCPTKAIYDTPIVQENNIITSIDSAKCFPEFESNFGCTVCIKECTFNNIDFEEIKKSFKKNT